MFFSASPCDANTPSVAYARLHSGVICLTCRSYALEAIVTSKSVSSDLAVDDESILKRVWGLMK